MNLFVFDGRTLPSKLLYFGPMTAVSISNIFVKLIKHVCFVCLFDLILYVPSTIFQLYRDGSSWVEPVLS